MPRPPDWSSWLRRWDAQQEGFNPDRERRFDAMLDLLAAAVPRNFRVLDLGCGPGSLTLRLLRRFPGARAVAVDYDPVVLRIGRGALARFGTRVTWVDAKFGARGWTAALPRGRYHGALSTTALHWLDRASLGRLYGDLAPLLRPGGIFLNGDRIPWGARGAPLGRLARRVRRERQRRSPPGSGWAGWDRWWKAVEREPALRPLLRERAHRHAQHPRTAEVTIDQHRRELRRAGFRVVDLVWQNFDDRILCALR
jgi:SAM-dependent methyltransferase